MQGVTFRSDQDFEEICCYLMREWALKNIGHDLYFRRYGGNGQKQFGIDIFPATEGTAVFGQAKFVDRLTYADIVSELNKTDNFPGLISYYVVITTANRHTSINEQQLNGLQYKRKNGGIFPVYVVYWDEIEDISFVPQNILQKIFPSVFKIAGNVLTSQQISASIAVLQKIIPRYFRSDFIDWLETWDFSCGYIPSVHYDAVNNLYIELDRVRWGMKGIHDFLYSQDRVELSQALPAGDEFFSAISDFRNAIYNYITIVCGQDGQDYVTLQGMNGRNATDFPKITGQWHLAAQHLARMYREKILGQQIQ